MSVEMESVKRVFLEESEDLLEEMERALLVIESDPDDADSVNAVFRAAHTIKGSSGIFGYDDVVSFTHVAESLLDLIREGKLTINEEIIATLLQSGDHMGNLVRYVVENDIVDGNQALPEELQTISAELIGQLNQQMGPFSDSKGEAESHTPVAISDGERTASGEVTVIEGDAKVSNENWHISLRFGLGVYKQGMDPQSFIRYLQRIGEVVSIVTLVDKIPALDEMDAEDCYLGFEISFSSEESKEEIESVFDFVREDCQIRILPPDRLISEYIELIRDLPEEDSLLGEILVKSKVLTERELNSVLNIQKNIGEETGSEPLLGEVLVDAGVVKESVVSEAVEKQQAVRSKKNNEARSVRVDSAKLDALINLVGELVIANSGSYLLAQRSHSPELMEANAVTARLVEEIRDSALHLRMVPIGETFTRFKRVVRDVSRELGKDIDLVINGAETELDKTVVEKIGDPLMHLVRNGMDHGIENPEERLAQDKPATAKLTLSAYHDSGSIVIEVSDDGRGLNAVKLIQKAEEKGLLERNKTLTDKEAFHLIFEPGFSTAEAVTNLSGRGVGMDVVRKNIESLRGTIDIESKLGIGTTMRIRLPLTLAIIDGFLVGVDKTPYVIPLDMVIECVELNDDEELTIDRNYINLRGEVLPFIRLSDMFKHEHKQGLRESIVVVQYGGKKAGIVVDELMGEFQTVIKPLGKIFQHLSGISGSTIIGSGEVAVILDVAALVDLAAGDEALALRTGPKLTENQQQAL